MIIEQVKQRIDDIKAIILDDEMAHASEDKLHQDVLRAIANGEVPAEDLKMVALLALSTEELNFARWCA